MPNGRHRCVICHTMLIEWDMPCPRCGSPTEVAEGKRDETADEILKRNNFYDGNEHEV